MATYALGDIQGCYDELRHLLDDLAFDPAHDTLWFVGDLVNRGPQSLATLRFVRGLKSAAISVLGNHDIHLLAVAAGHATLRRDDTFTDVLTAPDREELLAWLRGLPLLHHDDTLGYTLLHAGLPPSWNLAAARAAAAEAEAVLRGDACNDLLKHLYGDAPAQWSDTLMGWGRLRFIINCYTRLRFCDAQGRLALKAKGAPGSQPPGFLSWFEVPGRASHELKIVFGHWSTLSAHIGRLTMHNVFPLDSGCVWGGALTAMRLDGATPYYVSLSCTGAGAPGEE